MKIQQIIERIAKEFPEAIKEEGATFTFFDIPNKVNSDWKYTRIAILSHLSFRFIVCWINEDKANAAHFYNHIGYAIKKAKQLNQ